jgi:pesticin/yersiniabactin receptor
MKTAASRWAGLALCAGGALAQSQGASAQATKEGAGAALPTIEITATKRSQKASEIAGTVDTVEARDLAARGFQSVDRIDRVAPGLHIRPRSSRAYTSVTIRGQSSVDFYNPTAQLYVDGLPQDQALFSQRLPLGLERVEVLYGPQGTLYGRGAVGGIISLVTRKPDNERRFESSAEMTSRGRSGQLLVNVPLVENTFYADLALGTRKERGEMRDMDTLARVGDGEDLSGRLRLRYAPTGGPLEVMFSAARDVVRSHEEYFVNGPDLGARKAVPAPSYYRLRTSSYGLTASYDFGPVVLSSLTGYQVRDLDRTVFGSYTPEHQKSFSQELRLASTPAPGRALDYVGGLYYQDIDFARHVPAANLASQQRIRSSAVYGEATWHLGDRLDLVPGLRFEQERVRADTRYNLSAMENSRSFSATSPKLGLNYRLDDAWRLYALYSTGFKAGGFTRAVTPQNIGYSYAPQKSRNLEIGAKAGLLDNRLDLSAALYFMRTGDYQLSVGPVQGQYLQNVGTVKTRGLDFSAEFQATRELHLKAGLSLNDAWFSRYRNPANPGTDLTGNKVPYAPPVTANLAVEYVIPLGEGGSRLVPRIGLSHIGKTYFNEFNTTAQKAYTLVDLGVSWQVDKNLSADFYLDNAAGKVYAVYGFDAGPYGTVYQLGRGRTAGVRVNVRF